MTFQKMFKKFDFKTSLKFAGIGVFSLLVLGLLLSLGSFALKTVFNIAPNYRVGINDSYDGGYKMAYDLDESIMGMPELSMRNIAPDFDSEYVAGSDLEDFEVTEYDAYIRTARLEKVCDEIEGMKELPYVIFESSNRNDFNCNYRLKVTKEEDEQILAIISNLKPENLNVNTEIIKKQIVDFTNEEEILTKRLEQVEKTLEEAQDAYDEVTWLATQSSDVESLAKIINDKIILIEKLTTERLNTKNNLDMISRAKADQLERLDYTFFTVNVTEYLIVDLKGMKDSWKRELKNFVSDFNGLLQGLTIKLLSFALILVQVAIYLILALLVGKYGWRFVKFVWKK